jgi:ubiquinone/menaquinone biosynthesis C-methylase UbiE
MYYDDIAEGYNELHEKEQLRKLKVIKENLEIKPEHTLLDVGCGTGISTLFSNAKATGIDPSKKLLDQADKSKARFIQCSAEQLFFTDKSFDIVISVTAIQNFNDIRHGLEEIRRVGKRYALSVLKCHKLNEIEKEINNIFDVKKRIDQGKDIIFICE